MTGDAALAYFGVPSEYPGFRALSDEMTDAMFDAAQAVVDEQCARDPFLAALVAEEVSYWISVAVDPVTVPAGTKVLGYGTEAYIVSVDNQWLTLKVGSQPELRSISRTEAPTVVAVMPCPLDGASFRPHERSPALRVSVPGFAEVERWERGVSPTSIQV